MGYRNYLGSMPKREYNKIKSLTEQEVYDFYELKSEFPGEKPYKGVYQFGPKLHELGAYVDFEKPKKHIKPFFKNKETQKVWGKEHDFFVVTPEFLKHIIEHYRSKVEKNYRDMILPLFPNHNGLHAPQGSLMREVKTNYSFNESTYEFDFSKITIEEQTAIFNIIQHVKGFALEWMHLTPFNLENGDSITTSWKYEYNILELVRIYKHFDWKRNVMIYYGY